MFGEGNMYTDGADASGNKSNGSDFEDGISLSNSGDNVQQLSNASAAQAAAASVIPKEYVKIIDRPERKIVEIRIFFDDGTYETFSR